MTSQKVQFLKNISFFSHLKEDFLQSIIEVITHKTFNRGDIVFRKGDLADGMYLILDGTLGVTVNIKLLAQLKKGDFFGEMGLIAAAPRMATIGIISEKASVLFISKIAFDKIKTKISPQNQKEILRRVLINLKK